MPRGRTCALLSMVTDRSGGTKTEAGAWRAEVRVRGSDRSIVALGPRSRGSPGEQGLS